MVTPSLPLAGAAADDTAVGRLLASILADLADAGVSPTASNILAHVTDSGADGALAAQLADLVRQRLAIREASA